jgi:hypothetical protein
MSAEMLKSIYGGINMKDKISRWTNRPPWRKSVYGKGIILEKAVSALRCKGRTASIAFVYTLRFFSKNRSADKRPFYKSGTRPDL